MTAHRCLPEDVLPGDFLRKIVTVLTPKGMLPRDVDWMYVGDIVISVSKLTDKIVVMWLVTDKRYCPIDEQSYSAGRVMTWYEVERR